MNSFTVFAILVHAVLVVTVYGQYGGYDDDGSGVSKWNKKGHGDDYYHYNHNQKHNSYGAKADYGGKGEIHLNGKKSKNWGKGKFHFSKGKGTYNYDNYHKDKGGQKKYYDNGYKAHYGGKGNFYGKGAYNSWNKHADMHYNKYFH
ncbi:PREDICTED: uncharacterized protein LOC106810609 [Priapulus caudatus]|uniref:Uncharacterized protein LOC106810609 n=1 Tax=Priapulus caudatus TaxID=37621 RepID=A0ABM1EBD0_PRICU|nr:PREDICTED: uncharacterized protein LOC106810609 [Priapulus caudatus]